MRKVWWATTQCANIYQDQGAFNPFLSAWPIMSANTISKCAGLHEVSLLEHVLLIKLLSKKQATTQSLLEHFNMSAVKFGILSCFWKRAPPGEWLHKQYSKKDWGGGHVSLTMLVWKIPSKEDHSIRQGYQIVNLDKSNVATNSYENETSCSNHSLRRSLYQATQSWW